MAALHPQQELDRQVCFALHAASRAVVRAYGPLLEDAGLTYTQYLTMLVLWETPGQPISIGALGERLQLDSGTLTPLCKRLEALGYVERHHDPDDERRVLVALTAAGSGAAGRAGRRPAHPGGPPAAHTDVGCRPPRAARRPHGGPGRLTRGRRGHSHRAGDPRRR